MSGRVTGYRYAVGADGRKHRVYDGAVVRSAPAAAQTRRTPRKPRYTYVPRAPSVIRGHGGYYDSGFVKTMRKALPAGSFEKAGQMVGGPLGGYAGSLLSKIAGFGEYKVASNSLINEGQSPAAMHSTSDITVVRHREYIADIVSNASQNTFQNQVFPIQPGLSGSFPWLNAIANQFEQYTIRGMVFEFKTLFADAIASSQANSSVGGVILATDYNVLNPPFTTKQQMDNTQYTTSCKPSVSFYHPIECKPGSMPTNQFFMRSGANPSGDLRLYDLGNLQVASFGIAASSVVLGELWCTYDIEFSKPITKDLTSGVLTDHFQLVGPPTASMPLGSVQTEGVPNSSLGGEHGGTQYFFPADIQDGTFLVVYSVIGSSTASVTTPALTTINCTILDVWNNDSSAAAVTSISTCSSMIMAFVVQMDFQSENPASITWGTAGTLPASITSGDLWITELDSDITT